MASKGLYTEERLAKPIKHFISHFVQELLIGIPSEVRKNLMTPSKIFLNYPKKRYIWHKDNNDKHSSN